MNTAKITSRLENVLSAMDLQNIRRRAYSVLSGGERQRTRIAQLMMQHPKVWLLDEPFNHLDWKHQAQLVKLVTGWADHYAVFIATHSLAWVRTIATHVMLWNSQGELLTGIASDILKWEILSEALDCKDASEVYHELPKI